jgi:hypothetical protein
MHDENELPESESESESMINETRKPDIKTRKLGLGTWISIILISPFLFFFILALLSPRMALLLLLYILPDEVSSRLFSGILKIVGSLFGANCNATGIGFPGMFLLPLLFIRKWKWPNFWRRDK